MFNYKVIEKQAERLLNDIFASSLAITVTYKKKVDDTSDNPPTGSNTEISYDNYEIKVIRSNTALESQGSSTVLSAIGFEVGEQFFIVRYKDMPRDPYSKKVMEDAILIDGSERSIKKAVPVFNTMVKIRV